MIFTYAMFMCIAILLGIVVEKWCDELIKLDAQSDTNNADLPIDMTTTDEHEEYLGIETWISTTILHSQQNQN